LRSQLRMYVQVSDESETHIFKIQAIGPMVSFSQPEAQLDRLSNLHVIYQAARASLLTRWSVLTATCAAGNYDYYNTRPRLHIDDNGGIAVLGGSRRVKPDLNDMPAVKHPTKCPRPP